METNSKPEVPDFLIQVGIEVPGGPQLQASSENLIKGSERQLEAAAAVARQAGIALKDVFEDLAPSKGSVEFTISFEGEAGLPVIAKGKASASLAVSLEWEGNPQ